MEEISKQIKTLIKGESTADPAVLEIFSKDASIFKVRPQAVAYPKDVADIAALVKFASVAKDQGQDVSITVRAAGSDMSGGSLGQSIILSMTRYFNQIVAFGKDSVVVQPGVFFRDFETAALKRDLMLPSFPASKALCTLGGMVANNAGGELNLKYGKTDRYVQQVKMVCADGKEYAFGPISLADLKKKQQQKGFEGQLYTRIFELIDQNYDLIQAARPNVSKNSAGYFLWNVYDRQKDSFDLSQLIVGSQGTLGIITEIKFKLVKPQVHERLLVIFLDDLQQIPGVVSRLLKFKPQSIESYDDKTFRLAIKLLPDIVAKLGGGVFKLLFGFLPEIWMVLTGGLPKLVLLVEFSADSETAVLSLARSAQKSLSEINFRSRLIENREEAEKYWVIRRESFNMLRHHIRGIRTVPFIDDFVVKPEVLGEFMPKLYAILNKYDLTYTVAGHVGDGNFHIIPLMKRRDPKAAQIIEDLSREVYNLVFAYKGSISGEHNDGLVRSQYLKQMYGAEVFGLFEETKKIFDPQNIFNPGKKVNHSVEYANSHIDI